MSCLECLARNASLPRACSVKSLGHNAAPEFPAKELFLSYLHRIQFRRVCHEHPWKLSIA